MPFDRKKIKIGLLKANKPKTARILRREGGSPVTLDKLEIGRNARILSVTGQGALRRRLLDMGLTPGTEVTVCKAAPMGDPIELELRGYSLSLRLEDASGIEVKPDGAV